MRVSTLSPLVRCLFVLSILSLCAACTTSTGEGSADGATPGDPVVGVLPGEPGWQPRTPPQDGLCVGVDPGEAAFELSRTIAEEAARALAREQALADARAAEGDSTEATDTRASDTDETDAALADAEEAGDATRDDGVRDTAVAQEAPPAPQAEPCTPDYQDAEGCIGYEAPSFAAYDFQPQSCGFGATYGLDAFKGRVTFVALFASW